MNPYIISLIIAFLASVVTYLIFNYISNRRQRRDLKYYDDQGTIVQSEYVRCKAQIEVLASLVDTEIGKATATSVRSGRIASPSGFQLFHALSTYMTAIEAITNFIAATMSTLFNDD